MKYLLDTSVIVDFLRKKWLIPEEVLSDGVGVSIITYAELLYGVYKSNDIERNLNLVEKMFEELEIDIIGLSRDIVREYAKIKAALEKKGTRLDDLDLLIASTGLGEDLTLITRNAKHFTRIKKLKILETTV